MIETIIGFVVKRVWRKIFPKYTEREVNRRIERYVHRWTFCIERGDKWRALTARRKVAQFQIKRIRIQYLEDMRETKELCKHAKTKD